MIIIQKHLINKITDANQQEGKVKRFAELQLTVDDIKDIYPETEIKKEADVKKTAAAEVEVPKGKVQLQTASVEESESDNSSNKIREANKRLVSSFRSNDGVY